MGGWDDTVHKKPEFFYHEDVASIGAGGTHTVKSRAIVFPQGARILRVQGKVTTTIADAGPVEFRLAFEIKGINGNAPGFATEFVTYTVALALPVGKKFGKVSDVIDIAGVFRARIDTIDNPGATEVTDVNLRVVF